jgi:hypothetical protein
MNRNDGSRGRDRKNAAGLNKTSLSIKHSVTNQHASLGGGGALAINATTSKQKNSNYDIPLFTNVSGRRKDINSGSFNAITSTRERHTINQLEKYDLQKVNSAKDPQKKIFEFRVPIFSKHSSVKKECTPVRISGFQKYRPNLRTPTKLYTKFPP